MSENIEKRLYNLYFSGWLFDAAEENLLSLGDVFNQRIGSILEFNAKLKLEIKDIPLNALTELVSEGGQKSTETHSIELIELDQHFRELSNSAPLEVKVNRDLEFTIWALGLRPRTFADFGYWAKFDRYSTNELVWLSTGLSPKTRDEEARLGERDRFNVFPLAEIARRRQLISRAFPLGSNAVIESRQMADWMRDVRFEGHHKFHEMIDVAAQRSQVEEKHRNHKLVSKAEAEMQPRQFHTAARIIAAMAADCYGYTPNQKRSKATSDILNACDLAGLSVSNDTILKYLRAAEVQLDKNRK